MLQLCFTSPLIYRLVAVSSHSFSAMHPYSASCHDSCPDRANGEYNCVNCEGCPYSIDCRNGRLVEKHCGGYYCNNCDECPKASTAATTDS